MGKIQNTAKSALVKADALDWNTFKGNGKTEGQITQKESKTGL